MVRAHFLLLWPLVLISTPPAHAQPAPARCPPLQLLRPGARAARLPVRVRRNLLLVPVLINERGPFQMVLDTGVATAILPESAARAAIGLPLGEALLVEGAGEDAPLRATYHAGVPVKLPGAAGGQMPLTVLSDDALHLSRYVGEPVAGLIGYDVFRAFVVEARPARGHLRLHDPAHFRAPRKAARLPLALRAGKPYLRARVRQVPDTSAAPGAATHPDTLTATLLLDTGAGHALSLETGAHAALRLPPARLRAQLGRGLSGTINGWLGRAEELALGPFVLRKLLVSFPDSAAARVKARVPRHGTLGYETLKRFRVWFDYPGRAVWLRPAARLREPFEHDMSGMDVVARGPSFARYVVATVQPGGPAAEAGLAPGDELLAIDGRSAGEFSLTTLGQLLHSRPNRQVALLVRRGAGELFYTMLRLRREI